MDYSILIKKFSHQAFKFERYKQLPLVFSIFLVIALIPFYLVSFCMYIAFNVQIFLFKLLSSSVDYLENWVKQTKEDTGSLAEAVIYLVSMPIIFMIHIFLSLFSVYFAIQWFLLQCLLYISSLANTKWQPYINQAEFKDGEVLKKKTANAVAAGIFSVGAFVLFVLSVVFYFLVTSGDITDYEALDTINKLKTIFTRAYVAVVSIFVPLIFNVFAREEIDEKDFTREELLALVAEKSKTQKLPSLKTAAKILASLEEDEEVLSLKKEVDEKIEEAEQAKAERQKTFVRVVLPIITSAVIVVALVILIVVIASGNKSDKTEETVRSYASQGKYSEAYSLLKDNKMYDHEMYWVYKYAADKDYVKAIDYGLTDLVLPEGTTEISDCQFQNCNKLKSITIPSSVKKIGQYAFTGCTSLVMIKFSDSTTWYRSYNYSDAYNGYGGTQVDVADSIGNVKMIRDNFGSYYWYKL